ncbi:MAG: hypothetical protein HZA93_15000 [Verrucomicrobia bacterium]|nr:hypothetical protein [Verrucomicrobiota bacterium]
MKALRFLLLILLLSFGPLRAAVGTWNIGGRIVGGAWSTRALGDGFWETNFTFTSINWGAAQNQVLMINRVASSAWGDNVDQNQNYIGSDFGVNNAQSWELEPAEESVTFYIKIFDTSTMTIVDSGNLTVTKPSAGYGVRVRIAATGATAGTPIWVKFYQGGIQVASIQCAGALTEQDIDFSAASVVTAKFSVSTLDRVGSSFFTGGGTEAILAIFTPDYLNDGTRSLVTMSVAVPKEITPDSSKTVWELTGNTLDAGVYREGVDKIVAQLKAGGGSGSSSAGWTSAQATESVTKLGEVSVKVGEVKAEITGVKNDLAAIKTATETAARFYGRFDGHTVDSDTAAAQAERSTQVTAITAAAQGFVENLPAMQVAQAPAMPAASGEISFGTLAVLGSTIEIKPFTFFPQLLGWAAIIRELLLLGICLVFIWFVRREVDTYIRSVFQTAQAAAAPSTVPVVGDVIVASKQGILAAMLIGAFATAVAVGVGAANTQLGVIAPGLFTGGIGGAAELVSGITGSALGAFGPAVAFLNQFIPIGAYIQLQLTALVFAWGMPAVFAIAMFFAKYVRF